MKSITSQPAIDPQARQALAELLRRFVAGKITNREFENTIPKSQDPAIFALTRHGAWFLYDDFEHHKLVGRWKVSKANHKEIARWILFLKSDLTYEWPTSRTWVNALSLVLVVLSFVVLLKAVLWLPLPIVLLVLLRKWQRKSFDAHGNLEVWPFLRRADYDKALREPPYLTKTA